jgi:hypothetical protein
MIELYKTTISQRSLSRPEIEKMQKAKFIVVAPLASTYVKLIQTNK